MTAVSCTKPKFLIFFHVVYSIVGECCSASLSCLATFDAIDIVHTDANFVTDCRGIASPDCPAVNQIVDSLDEIQYLTELNDADISSVQSIFEDRCLHALLSVF